MRYLIFSDTHLTHQFEPKKFDILKEAIAEADRVIINGDFFDGYTTAFDKFVDSPWKDELFPLLKQKHAIYLYGNHDSPDLSDKRTSLFSEKQSDTYEFKSGKYIFHAEHGHRIYPLYDETYGLKSKYIYFFSQRFEDVMIRVFGKTFMKLMYGRWNSSIKKKLRNKKGKKEIMVIGHTHFQDVDLASCFVNSGLIEHGLAQYIYIEDGAVKVVSKKY